ncbi:mesothelin-like protein [Kryptolebias marmoratus]|uniref:mesothelin-like protein n=1 Tax=Kryptolebias marmoratus TaxID=37003 RepID=UPI0018ACD2D6|nr:mesothelin-like protein [Kryptolebias marmoratus]
MDIVKLSTQNINMDVDVFRSLDPNVITGLTVTDVLGLVGDQLQDLKLFENDTMIQTWVNLQLQSDLDKLGVGLMTNRTTAEPSTSSSPGTATSNEATVQGTTSSPKTTQASSTSGGQKVGPSPTFVVLSVLLTALLQILRLPA